VLADGFFEGSAAGGREQSCDFHLRGGEPVAFAGPWGRRARGGEPVESCTSIATGANAVIGPVHDRVPVILRREDHARWLDGRVRSPDRLPPLLRPDPAGATLAHPVGQFVE
jgi:putative SOS response-associated peptidase YedK